MARYIDADKKIDTLISQIEAIRKLRENRPYDEEAKILMRELIYCRDEIDNTPTADVTKVKHGKWILEYRTCGKMICSECKNEAPIINEIDNSLQLQTSYVNSPYCYHCGAKMDGGRDT